MGPEIESGQGYNRVVGKKCSHPGAAAEWYSPIVSTLEAYGSWDLARSQSYDFLIYSYNASVVGG
jgi:hypothetical protein